MNAQDLVKRHARINASRMRIRPADDTSGFELCTSCRTLYPSSRPCSR
jgi:hypothetical protein